MLHGEDEHGLSRQGKESGKSHLDDLKAMYQQLTPSSQLDITMVTEWGRTDIQEFFDDDDDADDGIADAQLEAAAVQYSGSQQTPQRRKLGF